MKRAEPIDPMLEAHAFLVSQARRDAPALLRCLMASGPQAIPPRRHDTASTHLARAVIGQQLSTATARVFWERIRIASHSSDMTVVSFLERTPPDQLRFIGLSSKKIKSIKSLLSHCAARNLHDATLAKLDHQGRLDELTAVWGVGRWTVEMLSIFHFREADVWPCTDGSVQSALEKILRWRKVSPERVDSFGRAYAPWRSYLALHVWHWLDNRPT
jgi:DNA-3-methyladenine glycosylase II